MVKTNEYFVIQEMATIGRQPVSLRGEWASLIVLLLLPGVGSRDRIESSVGQEPQILDGNLNGRRWMDDVVNSVAGTCDGDLVIVGLGEAA